MTTFQNREDAFENKFAHDEELRFKAEARRNKLLGLWAAEKLGFSDDKAGSYAAEVVESDFEEVGDEDVYRKISGDFSKAGVDVGEEELRKQMHDLMGEAIRQIEAGE